MLRLVRTGGNYTHSLLKVLWGSVDDRATDSLPIWTGLIRRANGSTYG
jgi:hypothetical protein